MSGNCTLLHARVRVPKPWKNGGGTTTEIAVHPAGASLHTFDWRVSMAEVAESGPFSEFPSVDRTLAVLSGNGLRLYLGDQPAQKVTVGSDPISFSGDRAVRIALIDGPVRDLNVMTRRGTWRHTLKWVAGSDSLPLAASAPVSLFLCHQGSAQIETPTGTFDLVSGDALLTEGSMPKIEVRATSGIYHIELWPNE